MLQDSPGPPLGQVLNPLHEAVYIKNPKTHRCDERLSVRVKAARVVRDRALERPRESLRFERSVHYRRSMLFRRHPAAFDDTTIYYTWVTGGKPLTPHKVAQRLLNRGVAETSTSSRDGEVRLAPRYKAVHRSLRDAQKHADFVELVGRGDLRTAARRHPLGVSRIVWWLGIHRLKTIFRTTSGESTVEPNSLEETAQMMRDLADDVAGSVYRRQAVSAIFHAAEKQMYRPGYLESEPYLRLQLRHLKADLFTQPSPDKQTLDFLLNVHRSGVVLMTTAVELRDGASTQELVRYANSGNVPIYSAKVSKEVHSSGAYPNSPWNEPAELGQELVEGTSWDRFHLPDGVALDDVYRLYRQSIQSVGEIELEDEWMCYPTITVGSPACCKNEKAWKRNHQRELSALLHKVENPDIMRESPAHQDWAPADSSYNTGSSLWHSSASTLSIHWSGPRAARVEVPAGTLLVIENYLLQLWFVRLMSGAVASSVSSLRSIRRTQVRLAAGLDEYYQSAHQSESARLDVDKMLEHSGALRMQQQVQDRLTNLSGVLVSARAERIATRSLFAGVAALVIAALAGLPSINSTLSLASEVPVDSAIYKPLAPVRWVAGFEVVGAWAVLGAVVFCMTGLLIVMTVRIKKRQPRSRAVGYAWPLGTIRGIARDEVAATDYDEIAYPRQSSPFP